MKIPRVLATLSVFLTALFMVPDARPQASADSAKPASSPQLVIIDTDIGDDIDDAFALALEPVATTLAVDWLVFWAVVWPVTGLVDCTLVCTVV